MFNGYSDATNLERTRSRTSPSRRSLRRKRPDPPGRPPMSTANGCCLAPPGSPTKLFAKIKHNKFSKGK